MFEDSLKLWDNNAGQLWLHVVGIHAIGIWLYGLSKNGDNTRMFQKYPKKPLLYLFLINNYFSKIQGNIELTIG